MTGTSKTALITGSGKNIGRAVALRLAADGFNIVLNGSRDRNACEAVAAEVKELDVDVIVAMGDVGRIEDCEKIVKISIGHFKSIDVLVNNAAIRPSSLFLEMDLAEWKRVLDVDLNAAFWLAKGFVPGMLNNGWGRIINFAGMNAIHGYNGRAHVSVAKHGAWGLVKALGKEFGPKGITANIISPGPIKGEYLDPEEIAHLEHMKQKVPIGRLGDTAEIAEMVSLLSSQKGSYINGQLIQINGGAET
ncbi:MAG: 3-oxoacyl-[acyl-carrier-protein] reductase FabG [Alphaproteobacteria bacterium MarineAlpha3_Bin5]|nr:3-oxoacyl-ACP reductase [Magnetovibrio sp.]PPR77198.1 MAG: 3-oxoacyl-[acyl-carrier-protein] reductase FabG [Alphaproteobacteria bacterium MarineAlpha3_Bin5]